MLSKMAQLTVPPSLKPVQHYIKTATEHEKRDAVVSYYCTFIIFMYISLCDKPESCQNWNLFSLLFPMYSHDDRLQIILLLLLLLIWVNCSIRVRDIVIHDMDPNPNPNPNPNSLYPSLTVTLTQTLTLTLTQRQSKGPTLTLIHICISMPLSEKDGPVYCNLPINIFGIIITMVYYYISHT